MSLARFRIPALLWICLWYGLIVPAHQRGQITLPGATISASCCANKAATGESKQPCAPGTPGSPAAPSEERIRACFVCYIVAVTQPAPEFRFTPPPSYLLAEIEPAPFLALAGIDLTPPSRGRDPPPAFAPLA